MNDFELEKEELSLIYNEGFRQDDDRKVTVNITNGIKHANVTFEVPESYPNEIPRINVEIVGSVGAQLVQQLEKTAKKMVGISMLAYLVGEALDYISGIPDKEFAATNETLSQTPFTRENFLLWLEAFNEEKRRNKPKLSGLTGRQIFEQGLAGNV